MNDPWDVKSVRQSDQYISCMKLNGVPLLPPVLSKECHEEMRNYKFLALEVEKRIETLKSLTLQSDVNSSEDETDAPELPESDQTFDIPSVIESNSYKNKSLNLNPNIENGYEDYKFNMSNDNNSPTLSNVSECFSSKASSKLVIDLSLSINDTARNLIDSNNTSQTPNDLPERDCDCVNDNKNVGSDETKKQSNAQEKVTVSLSINKQSFSDPLPNFHLEDGPASLGSKSFTGSLTDLHKESTKEVKTAPLLRQRSYTVLKPSPMLLAHLEVQSLNRGVDVKSISMSESLSNVSCMNKKRRSWDLESAKIKWSSMALELKEKVKEKHLKHNSSASSNIMSKTTPKKAQSNTPSKLKPMDKSKRVTPKASVKSEPAQRPTKLPSPVRCSSQNPKPSSSQNNVEKKTEETKHKPISESEDPATKVRELYEKVQKQQLVQMANLVEKQKREQILLHQLFEEQNNLLFTQLKTICPKSPNEVKEAWVEKDADRGPVSLSQLINQKTEPDSPVIATLTETNNYLNQCDQILKKSRNMSESIKRPPQEKPSTLSLEGSITRTHSPNTPNPNISRKLVYDTSASSERDYDVVLTDRTNDTLADLNVTFPSDHSESRPNSTLTNTCIKQTIESPLSAPVANASHRSSERAVKSMEETLQDSLRCIYGPRTKQKVRRNPTAQEREAATKIVACAKGYLVRRLMRTERVQTTVQTIRDTLVLALQLHQDGRGIWGADVDLHRRLIQQITAACYTLHDTFVASTAAERCALIAADRSRRKALAARPLVPVRQYRPTDVMSASHSGAFPARPQRSSPSLMTQSSYESYSGEKARRYVPSPRRRPWR
ncbi:uncharacterized protein LOC121733210 isoform X2 [Aricia agestis]|uniref:uncharacterized protein LOC121733210 isoform X2 n=1 Tax=Aricia agestis TaxID=91739 RepID=UPI001C205B8F|nr:uncharacterized protein LOC121733210 isoform X2 [Aricia agestis]